MYQNFHRRYSSSSDELDLGELSPCSDEEFIENVK